MLGTLIAESEVLPNFSISRADLLRNVAVTISRNPSTYSHNSFHSGKYRLMGYKHEITNNQAKTTLRIHKISLGDIK